MSWYKYKRMCGDKRIERCSLRRVTKTLGSSKEKKAKEGKQSLSQS